MRRGVYPPGARQTADEIRVSPAVISNGLVFLTGMTGSAPDGAISDDPETQFRAAFDKIAATLKAAGSGWEAAVEMTSYHVGLEGHFDLFNSVRADYVHAPYPAWTAVEVAGLRRAGALVEIRVIAEAGDPPQS